VSFFSFFERGNKTNSKEKTHQLPQPRQARDHEAPVPAPPHRHGAPDERKALQGRGGRQRAQRLADRWLGNKVAREVEPLERLARRERTLFVLRRPPRSLLAFRAPPPDALDRVQRDVECLQLLAPPQVSRAAGEPEQGVAREGEVAEPSAGAGQQ